MLCVAFREPTPQYLKGAVSWRTTWWRWRRSGWSMRREHHAPPSEKVISSILTFCQCYMKRSSSSYGNKTFVILVVDFPIMIWRLEGELYLIPLFSLICGAQNIKKNKNQYQPAFPKNVILITFIQFVLFNLRRLPLKKCYMCFSLCERLSDVVFVVSLLKDLKHANIVTLHDIVHTDKSLTLVFEYLVRLSASPCSWCMMVFVESFTDKILDMKIY